MSELANQYTDAFCALDNWLEAAWREQEEKNPETAFTLKKQVEEQLVWMRSKDAQLKPIEELVTFMARVTYIAETFKSCIVKADRLERAKEGLNDESR